MVNSSSQTQRPPEKRPAAAPAEPMAEAEPGGCSAATAWDPVQGVGAAPARRIRLDAAEWLWATWRPWTPPRRRAPKPFDRERALARLAHLPVSLFVERGVWSPAATARFLTREEAHFWFSALVQKPMGWRAARTGLREQPLTGEISLEEAREALSQIGGGTKPGILVPLANLLSLEELVQLILDPAPPGYSRSFGFLNTYLLPLITGFRTYVLPSLREAERERVRQMLRPSAQPDLWPAEVYLQPPSPFYLAACVGLHEELGAVVERWEDHRYWGGSAWNREAWLLSQRPQWIVFGLGDPSLVTAHMRRLRLPLTAPEEICAWLAHTECAALDWVRKSILESPPGREHPSAVRALGRVEAPEAAPIMLELMLRSRNPQAAREWLEEHRAHAIAGLIPLAGGRGRLAEAAADYLRELHRQGGAAALHAQIDALPAGIGRGARAAVLAGREEPLTPFDESTSPAWLQAAAVAGLELAKPPEWLARPDLPPIGVGNHRLNRDQVARLLSALQQSRLDKPHPLVARLKQEADRVALDAFARRLLQEWRMDTRYYRANWLLVALGLLGGDDSARDLGWLLPCWSREHQHDLVLLGLECLGAIGTNTALLRINQLARSSKFKAKCVECLEAAARDRGLSRDELQDRIVPDCGLDERGSRTFDLGPRQFRLVLGTDLKPLLQAETGEIYPHLPKLTRKDDPEMACRAIAGWKRLKQEVAAVAKVQAVRLEQAMVAGRAWPVPEFERWLIRHPLLIHLARRLVWGAYDSSDGLVATFRVTEDAAYANEQDAAIRLEGIAHVRIVHPRQLSVELQLRWSELLCDYQIVPAFRQLDRMNPRREPRKVVQWDLTRFNSVTAPVAVLMGTLQGLGWSPGIAGGGAATSECTKPFPGPGVTAILQYQQAPSGDPANGGCVKIERCFFVAGISRPAAGPGTQARVPLGEVDPLAVREVWSDLAVVAAQAR